jgi:hypothetical protein
VIPADGDGRAQSLVGVPGRHSLVDDRDIRVVFGNCGLQRAGIAHGRRDLVPPIGEQLHQPGADYGGVFGDDNAQAGAAHLMHATAARLSRQWGRPRAADHDDSVDGPDPFGQPAEPYAGIGAGAAMAVVDHPQPEQPWHMHGLEGSAAGAKVGVDPCWHSPVQLLLGQAELHGQSDEPGLCAVVQITLDAAQPGRGIVHRVRP